MKPGLLAFAITSCLLPMAAGAHEGGHDVRGVVVSIVGEELTVKSKHGSEKFALTPETEFVKNGAPATAQDLKASDRVVVHGMKKGGRMEAVKVQFAPSVAPRKP
jgi:Domain of unknown function (DUF5666)